MFGNRQYQSDGQMILQSGAVDEEIVKRDVVARKAVAHRRRFASVIKQEEARSLEVYPSYVPDEYAEGMIAKAEAERE